MKELSIEEKAIAYDEAIERAKKLQETCDSQAVVGWCEYILPELCESEDEKIRKALVDALNKNLGNGIEKYGTTLNAALAWLEKQGDKDKLIQELGEYKVKYTQEVLNEYLNINNKDNERLRKTTIDFLKEFADKGYENAIECIDWLEKQGNQKLPIEKLPEEMKTIGESLGFTTQEECDEYNQMVSDLIMSDDDKSEQKPVDKIEPRFKVGDWVVYDKYDEKDIDRIVKFENDRVSFESGDWLYINQLNEDYKLWTIKDALNGDVLHSTGLHNDYIFIFNGLDNWKFDEPNGDRVVATGYCCLSASADKMEFGTQGPDCIEVNTVKPATKEQRNTLFAKMKEAGYAFDFEKKELRKIEQKLADKPKFKVKYAGSEYNVFETKDIAGVTFYGIEDEPNHIDYVKADNCEIISGYDIKESGLSIPTKPVMFSAWSEGDEEILDKVITNYESGYLPSVEKRDEIIKKLKSLRHHKQWKPSDEQMEALSIATDICSIPEKYYTELSRLYYDLKKLKEK